MRWDPDIQWLYDFNQVKFFEFQFFHLQTWENDNHYRQFFQSTNIYYYLLPAGQILYLAQKEYNSGKNYYSLCTYEFSTLEQERDSIQSPTT